MTLHFRTLCHQCQKGGDKSIFEVKEQRGDTIKGGDTSIEIAKDKGYNLKILIHILITNT